MTKTKMQNVRIHDNGAAFMVMVDGLITCGFNSLGGAWRHIEWMWAVAQQDFTVGSDEIHVTRWIDHMKKQGFW